MLPQYHFLFGLLFSLALYPFFGFYSLIALAATVLIDIDHYIAWIIKSKNFSLKKTYENCVNNKIGNKLFIFHIAEFWILLALFSFYPHYSKYIFLIFLGVMFHVLFDLVYYIRGQRTFTLIEWLIKRKKQK